MTKQLFPFLSFLLTLSACKETPLQRADNDFDVSVSAPTFTSSKPTILFDEGHNNFHTTEGLYKPFANLVKNDGYNLKTLDQPVTRELLKSSEIFIIANAKGNGELNDQPAFSKAECDIISEWVTEGGSLLLIADHFPFGSRV